MNDLIPPYWTSPWWDIIGIDNIDKIILLGVDTINQVIIAWEKEIEKYNEAIVPIKEKLEKPVPKSPYHIQKSLEWDEGVRKFGEAFKKRNKKPKSVGYYPDWRERAKREIKRLNEKITEAGQIIDAFNVLKEKAEKLEGADKKPCLPVCRPFNYFSINEKVKIFTKEGWIDGVIFEKCGCYNEQDYELVVAECFGSSVFEIQIFVRSSKILKPDELDYLRRYSDFAAMWVMTTKIFNEGIDSENLLRSFSAKEAEKCK